MDAIHEKFVEEARELLADLEKVLLQLESTPNELALVEQAFRVMHTLKGASSMFGFNEVGNLTHDLETIYDLIREGKAVFTHEIQNTTFLAIDLIRELFQEQEAIKNVDIRQRYVDLQARVKNLATGGNEAQPSSKEQDGRAVATLATYHVSIRPAENMLATGTNPFFLIDDLQAMGTCLAIPHVENIPSLEEINEHTTYIHWNILLATAQGEEAINDVFLFAADVCKVGVNKIAADDILLNEDIKRRIEQAFAGNPELSFGELEQVIRPEQKTSKPSRKDRVALTQANTISSIRVPSERLDSMINIISELITTQARLALIAEKNHDSTIVSVTEDFEKLLRQLRDTSMGMCLVPLETLYTRFQRLVRDLSKGLGKDIELITDGGDTELDKSIIENLSDPILHLLRNSIDHGLEDSASRVASGKPAKGTIRLKSFYDVGRVIITIQDDGRGIDLARVRNKAVEKGLIAADAQLSDKEIMNLIFLPGFSTAEKVTEVSGRGVGMDAVQEKVKDMRGEIDINSTAGIGTTITLRFPLSLSIMDGLMVRIEDTFFVLPLASIDKCFEIFHNQIVSNYNGLIVLDGEQVPFINLREEYRLGGIAPKIEQAITIHHADQRVALIVDSIVGEYQAVLKPMTHLYKSSDAVLGATIMGDGTIALALDVGRVVKEFVTRAMN